MPGRQLLVYGKQELVKFDICLPEDLVGDFIVMLGKIFEEKTIDAGMVRRMVDKIYHQGGYHILVSLRDSEVGKFEKFMQDFCKVNSLEFRDF